MAKLKKSYFCTACGNESPKWVGKCPACGAWNTYTEELVAAKSNPLTTNNAFGLSTSGDRNRPIPVTEVRQSTVQRIDLLNHEFNRVLGGGLVPGSLVLLGGEPGIGKSTLALQVAVRLTGVPILYVFREESPQQIKMRADRIRIPNEQCLLVT